MSNIFFWRAGDTDACSFYRCIEPGRALRARGHDVMVDRQAGLADLMMSDVVVIQRPTEVPPQHVIAKLLSLPEDRRPRIVVELDDDLFNVPPHNPAQLSDGQKHRLAEAIGHADRVTVTNEHLAMIVGDGERQLPDGRVRVVPNYVPERFVVEKVPEAGHAPVITWAGSDTHRRDFDEVAVALRRLLRERDDFQVRIVGAPYAERLRTALGADLDGRGGFRITQVPWIEGVPRYIPTLAGHIGLAPLADDVFNRSKSDLRLRELAARGMAVVASDVGPYADSQVPHFRPDLTEGWHTALTTILNNPTPRAALAWEALEWAQANTLEAHAGEWEKALLD